MDSHCLKLTTRRLETSLVRWKLVSERWVHVSWHLSSILAPISQGTPFFLLPLLNLFPLFITLPFSLSFFSSLEGNYHSAEQHLLSACVSSPSPVEPENSAENSSHPAYILAQSTCDWLKSYAKECANVEGEDKDEDAFIRLGSGGWAIRCAMPWVWKRVEILPVSKKLSEKLILSPLLWFSQARGRRVSTFSLTLPIPLPLSSNWITTFNPHTDYTKSKALHSSFILNFNYTSSLCLWISRFELHSDGFGPHLSRWSNKTCFRRRKNSRRHQEELDWIGDSMEKRRWYRSNRRRKFRWNQYSLFRNSRTKTARKFDDGDDEWAYGWWTRSETGYQWAEK